MKNIFKRRPGQLYLFAKTQKERKAQIKKVWKIISLIIMGVTSLLIFLNPSLRQFEEFEGYKYRPNRTDIVIQKTENWLLFSKYHIVVFSEGAIMTDELYIGACGNFYKTADN